MRSVFQRTEVAAASVGIATPLTGGAMPTSSYPIPSINETHDRGDTTTHLIPIESDANGKGAEGSLMAVRDASAVLPADDEVSHPVSSEKIARAVEIGMSPLPHNTVPRTAVTQHNEQEI